MLVLVWENCFGYVCVLLLLNTVTIEFVVFNIQVVCRIFPVLFRKLFRLIMQSNKFYIRWNIGNFHGSRAGLTKEQNGQMSGASHFWEPRAWISKHSFTDFSYFSLLTTPQNWRAFWLLRLVNSRLRKLTTLAFIIFEWFKRVEPNSAASWNFS